MLTRLLEIVFLLALHALALPPAYNSNADTYNDLMTGDGSLEEPSPIAASIRLKGDLISVLLNLPDSTNKCTQMVLNSDFKAALDQCSQSIRNTPPGNEAELLAYHFARAYVNYRLDRIAVALNDLGVAELYANGLNPCTHTAAIYRFRGVLFTMLGQFGAAFRDFKRTGTARDVISFLHALVVQFEHRHDALRTIRAASVLLMLSGQGTRMAARAYFARGSALDASKKYEAAKDDYQKTHEIWSRCRHDHLGALQVRMALVSDPILSVPLLESAVRIMKSPRDDYFIGLAFFKLAELKMKDREYGSVLAALALAAPHAHMPRLEHFVTQSLDILRKLRDIYSGRLNRPQEHELAGLLANRADAVLICVQLVRIAKENNYDVSSVGNLMIDALKDLNAAAQSVDTASNHRLFWKILYNAVQLLATMGDHEATLGLFQELEAIKDDGLVQMNRALWTRLEPVLQSRQKLAFEHVRIIV